jgi:hypothetical protein
MSVNVWIYGSILTKSVVLPLPRKPVSTVTGTRSSSEKIVLQVVVIVGWKGGAAQSES